MDDVDEGGDTASVIVSLDKEVQGGFTVVASTTDDTADDTPLPPPSMTTPLSPQTLSFAGTIAGETQTFTVEIIDDDIAEGDETLMVSLASPSSTAATVTSPAAATTITITDNDTAVLTIDNVRWTKSMKMPARPPSS